MSEKTINLSDTLRDYMCKVSLREPSVLQDLRKSTKKSLDWEMSISIEQGQFMNLLIKMIGAKKIIELGVFTGYSALWMALALPIDGQLIACEVKEEWTNIGKPFWKEAKVDQLIDLRIAPALDTIQQLKNNQESNTFDLAFIDADKDNFDHYYEGCLDLVKPGGVILIDNVFWYGKVADPSVTDLKTKTIRALNEKILKDNRVEISMLPISDGLTIARKK